jgi:hypothetical protein
MFGALWLLSWFVIFLEVFRWHHMTTSLRLNPPPPIPGFPPPRAGGFLKSAIALSIASPTVFVALLVLRSLRAADRRA